jgi:hypothetical protein
MNFITDISRSNGCDYLWVNIDHFTTMAYHILLKTKENKAKNLVLVFAGEI